MHNITIQEEKRNQKRKNISLPLIFAYSGDHKINLHHGTTFDICDSGIGFFTDKPLHEGLNFKLS